MWGGGWSGQVVVGQDKKGGQGSDKKSKKLISGQLFFGTGEYWYLGDNKNKELFRKELNKLETKLQGKKKVNNLKNKLQNCKYSKQLIRLLNRKPKKLTESGRKKWYCPNSK